MLHPLPSLPPAPSHLPRTSPLPLQSALAAIPSNQTGFVHRGAVCSIQYGAEWHVYPGQCNARVASLPLLSCAHQHSSSPEPSSSFLPLAHLLLLLQGRSQGHFPHLGPAQSDAGGAGPLLRPRPGEHHQSRRCISPLHFAVAFGRCTVRHSTPPLTLPAHPASPPPCSRPTSTIWTSSTAPTPCSATTEPTAAGWRR